MRTLTDHPKEFAVTIGILLILFLILNITMATTVKTATHDLNICCCICQQPIEKGRRYMPTYDGTNSIAHATCWDRAWEAHMEQHRLQFEKEQKL